MHTHTHTQTGFLTLEGDGVNRTAQKAAEQFRTVPEPFCSKAHIQIDNFTNKIHALKPEKYMQIF